ncbi:LIC20211 family lipoprotein [Leptospira sp. GIMC2001]|uniref:LIC20211 family lipoprotein n=1 Tax=Leptospira sp. GIMC2001 TaxID=1513297 RepID=UPI002349C1FD|nr:hypothetical protein [Leptospira sp. GIMC2001]WCL48686.1 hypothetical protein O4O04_15445 [Leptospira sp. GIMC2001]
MKKNLILYFSLVCVILLNNCATSSAGLATSNIPFGDRKYTIIAPVTDEVSWYGLDIGIMGSSFNKPPIEPLIEKMIHSAEADALVNIRYFNEKSIYLFFVVHRFGISADAIKWDNAPPTDRNKRK